MELYSLDSTFLRDKVIEEYLSLVWTERYTKAGDMQLVIPESAERRIILAENRFVGMQGSNEPMIIESQSIEDGIMTVKGKTLETFFNERYIRTSDDPEVSEWLLKDKAGEILGTIVQEMVISGSYLSGAALGDIGGTLNAIPYLVVGDLDASGDEVSVKIPFGPMYDAMLPIAETHKLGMKVFLSHADAFGYELTFTTYKGLDRTSDQLENNLVRFSPAQDSLTNIKELRSVAGYKTVVYVFPPSWSSATPPVEEYAPGVDEDATGFDRRVLVVQASDISADQVTGGVTLLSLMQQKAKDALANNNYTKLVDGEVVPQPEYVYGEHYNLGDIIELAGPDDVTQKAMITEYIRSKDETGERAYPTVSVVD